MLDRCNRLSLFEWLENYIVVVSRAQEILEVKANLLFLQVVLGLQISRNRWLNVYLFFSDMVLAG
jgi:hypothetical protein